MLHIRIPRHLARVLAIGAFLACTPAAAQKVVFGFSASTAFANAYVAANEGIFKKHGLDVEMKLIPNTATAPAALLSGSLHIATPTAPNTMQAVDQGLDLVVLVGGGYYTAESAKDIAVVVRPDSPIQTAKDFEGKRVSTPGINAFMHVLFRRWMAENGADYNKVTYTENAFAQSVDVLRNGQVDAVLMPQPFLFRALDTGVGRVAAHYVASLDGIQSGWFVTSRKWADANPKQVAAFKAAIEEASALALKDPDVVRRANLAYIPLPADAQARFSAPRFRTAITADVVNAWNAIMLEQGMLKKPIDPARLVYGQ